MLKHQQSRLLSKAASKWHLQVATATALPATRSTHHFHTNSPVVYGSMCLLFSQATECRQLPQLMSCKWQSSPHRANWSHDQNGRRHVRLSNCRKYEMWTHGSVKIIWSPPILKVPKTHDIFRFGSYSWNFFRFEVESMCQKIWNVQGQIQFRDFGLPTRNSKQFASSWLIYERRTMKQLHINESRYYFRLCFGNLVAVFH